MLSFAAQEVKRANQDNVPSEENDAAVQQIFAVQAEEGGRRSCAGRKRGLCRVGNGSTQATQCWQGRFKDTALRHSEVGRCLSFERIGLKNDCTICENAWCKCPCNRYMTECGFLLPVEEDTMDIRLFEQIRELHFCDEELQWELIPMRRFICSIWLIS